MQFGVQKMPYQQNIRGKSHLCCRGCPQLCPGSVENSLTQNRVSGWREGSKVPAEPNKAMVGVIFLASSRLSRIA